MRIPRLRFTLRALMALVAIAAVILWAADRIDQNRLDYTLIYIDQFRKEGLARTALAREPARPNLLISLIDLESLSPPERERIHAARDAARVEMNAEFDETLRQHRKSWSAMVAYHAAMRAKYERLARYPWLPLTPDPPEPD